MNYWNKALTLSSPSAWDEVFTKLHGGMRISVPDRDAPWAGRLEWQQSQAYGLALCSGGEEMVKRDTRHIRSDPRGTYELLVPITGTAWMEQESASAELRPGSMALCDIDRPLTYAHGADFRSISFIMSGQDIAQRSPVAAGGSQLLDGAHGLGRVIRQLTTTLHAESGQLSETTFNIACDQLLDLVCLTAEGSNDTAPTGQRAAVEAAVRRYIRQHASDRDLDVASIARALGWSVRYVQKVLQEADTTAHDLIRRERLSLARTHLVGTSWSMYSIAQIAHSCGFGSHAFFATAFREEFGMTPREARYGAHGSSDRERMEAHASDDLVS